MFHFKNNYSKRKPRREYLYDDFSPQKSNIVIWLQRLILLVALIIIAMFVLSLTSLANAYEPVHYEPVHYEPKHYEPKHQSYSFHHKGNAAKPSRLPKNTAGHTGLKQHSHQAATFTAPLAHSSSLSKKVRPTFRQDDANDVAGPKQVTLQHSAPTGSGAISVTLAGILLLLLGFLSQLIHQPRLKNRLRQWHLM